MAERTLPSAGFIIFIFLAVGPFVADGVMLATGYLADHFAFLGSNALDERPLDSPGYFFLLALAGYVVGLASSAFTGVVLAVLVRRLLLTVTVFRALSASIGVLPVLGAAARIGPHAQPSDLILLLIFGLSFAVAGLACGYVVSLEWPTAAAGYGGRGRR